MICGKNCPNYHKINNIRQEVELNRIEELSNIFKILSDTTRLKIVCSLLNKEIRVSDISNNLNINRTTVSHHLKTLRDNKLVKFKQIGLEKYYSLKDPHIEQIILQGIDHIK